MGSRQRTVGPCPHQFRRRHRHLLLRPSLTLAARQQREHEWAFAPILPERHRPIRALRQLPGRGRRRTKRTPTQTLRLGQPRPSPQPATVTPNRNYCCNQTLKPPRCFQSWKELTSGQATLLASGGAIVAASIALWGAWVTRRGAQINAENQISAEQHRLHQQLQAQTE